MTEAPPVEAPSKPIARVPYLDYGRFAAAALVAMYHYNLQDPEPRRGFLNYGYLGVQFFFLISGFVISRSVKGPSLSTFLKKRFIRLYPSLFFAVLLLGAVKLVLHGYGERSVTPLDIVGNLTGISLTPLARFLHCDNYVIQPIWTLPYEIYFYLLLGIVSQIPNGQRWFMFSWIIFSFFESFRPGTVTSFEHALRCTTMYEVAPYFAGGYLLSVLYDRAAFGISGVFMLILCFTTSVRNSCDLPGYMLDWRAPWIPLPPVAIVPASIVVLFWLFFAWLVYSRKFSRPPTPRVLRLELALGAASYPMYLFHPLFNPVIKRLSSLLHSKYLAMSLCCLFTILLAHLVVNFLERPFQRLLSTWLLGRRQDIRSAEVRAGDSQVRGPV
jgi:peptidoglycan/LPS O-acetylase OafA/YrhL